jgi:hypothetical protein
MKVIGRLEIEEELDGEGDLMIDVLDSNPRFQDITIWLNRDEIRRLITLLEGVSYE